jgi:hypothetical protein
LTDNAKDPAAPPGGWFGRHPRLAMLILTVVLLVPCDLALGTLTNTSPLGAVRDPHYHHGLQPNVDEPLPWGGRTPRRITNSLGFRDSTKRAVPLVGEQRRILFIGDSFTEGLGVAYDQTFVGLIAAALAPRRIEVLNAGVQSYSPKLGYLKLKYLVENIGLKVDEIEFFIDISDLQDELLYEPFVPGYTRDYFVRRTSDWLTKHSLLARTVLDRLRHSWSDSVFRTFGADAMVKRGAWTTDDDAWKRFARGMTLAQENIARLADLCRDHGMTLRLAVYPWPEQIRAHDLESKQVFMWRDFARAHDLGFTNFFPDFIKPRADPEATIQAYFIGGDIHWNEAGHALIAQRWLEERGFAARAAPSP